MLMVLFNNFKRFLNLFGNRKINSVALAKSVLTEIYT